MTTRIDAKLRTYRHFMEKAMANEDWEKFTFWEKAYNLEWLRIYGNTIRKRKQTNA